MNPPPPPPPPPPHGHSAGNRNGLPDGNYDIFIIPPHSSGGGFIYLPSLQPHPNSFLAGVVCTLLAVTFWIVVLPVFKEWFSTIVAGGGMSVILLLLAVGVACWAWGKAQAQAGGSGHGGTGGPPKAHMPGHSAEGTTPGPTPGFAPGPGFAPNPGFAQNPGFNPGPGFTSGYTPPPEPRAPPKPTWQRANAASGNGTAKGGWEKAREETRKREEERKKAEELRRKREEEEKERVKQREKDARERELREAREKREKERAQERSRPASPTKGHRHPTAKTATDDDAYSYRPYDEPKRSAKTATASSIYSESSYAPSQSTSRTTPPPSHRGPYRCKDPDKIVLKAVYSFDNTFTKVPISKLVSGVGAVTDGLILRITPEGLFIDDDVRGVGQREWDIKAWSLNLVEVWCPHLHALKANSGPTPASQVAPTGSHGLFGKKWASKAPTAEESGLFLDEFSRACKPYMSGSSGTFLSSDRIKSDSSVVSQSGQFKGLHVLRASVRNENGKKYIFVLQEEEGWKVAVGLQRLRRGSQVRLLGVSGITANETKAILESMGWT